MAFKGSEAYSQSPGVFSFLDVIIVHGLSFTLIDSGDNVVKASLGFTTGYEHSGEVGRFGISYSLDASFFS